MVNGRKALYLLAGGRGGGNMDPIFDLVFKDIGISTPTIAYVGAANEDNPDFFQRMAGMLTKAKKCRVVQVLTYPDGADIKKAVDIMKAADAVFVSGGDVEGGMHVLEEKGMTGIFPEMYKEGKLFFGASAGSIMLAKQWVRWRNPDDDSTAELFPCLGLAPVICDTHGEGDKWEELKAAVALCPEGTPGYGITSGTCLKVVPDGKVQALAGPVSVYVRQRNSVARQTDLLPVSQ